MSVGFDDWNPLKEAYQDREFNSYDRGPGKYLGSANYAEENSVRLYVSNIPTHITEDGLRALFSKTGFVTNIWKHKEHGYAFVTMASLRDAEFAIRKLNDFPIEKYNLSVRVAKNDKEKATLMQQKKDEEEFFKKLHTGNKSCKDEDWNNDDYPTFSALDLQSKNICQNGGTDSGFAVKDNTPLEEDIMHSVHNLDASKNGKTVFEHLEQSNQLETRSRRSSKANVNASKKQLKPCKKCGKAGAKRCSQCKSPYCSIDCQQKDWIDGHHLECINICLGNASLEELADRFDVNLNADPFSNSHLDKSLKSEVSGTAGERRPTTFNDESPSNRNQRRSENGKMKKMPPGKKFNSKPPPASLNYSSSSHSSQSDVSPRKVSPGQDNKKKMFNKSKQAPSSKMDNSRENVQRPDFKQKSLPKSFQMKPDFNKSKVSKNQMKIQKGQLPLHEVCEVLVTNVASFEDIHIQPIEDVNVRMTTFLITELARVYGDGGKNLRCISSPEVGEVYACCFSADNLWYRAQVISIKGADITVRYIDYGNSEITSCDKMRDLIPELKEIPQQAVWCALDIPPSKTCDEINLLIKQEIKYDLPYRLKAIRTGEPYIIELYDQDGDVGKKLSNLIKPKKARQPSSDSYTKRDDIHQTKSGIIMVSDLKNKSDQLKTGSKYSILPFHVISPDEFMVQVVILDKKFHQFNEKIQNCASSCPPISKKPVLSQLVLTQKPDGQWCRAEVMLIEDASLTVRLLDYGIIETVSMEDVRSVPHFCCDHPIITVPSRLAEIKPVDKQGWSPKLCGIFQETLEAMNASVRVKEKHILGEYIGPDSDQRCLWKLIDLCTNASIADLLVLDGHAVLMNSGSSSSYNEKSLQNSKIIISDIPQIPLVDGSVQDGIAIDFQSDTFFINLIQSDLKEFQNNFNEYLDAAGYPGTNYIPSEKEIVAAKFSLDNQWYRGQIMKVHDDLMFTVFFIDYGNSELLASNQLQPLPKPFSLYPKQAIHCKLHNVSIPEDGLLQFAKLVLNNIYKYKIVSEDDETFNVVVYSSNGDCLNDMFKEEITNGYLSETESQKSTSRTRTSITGLSTEVTPEMLLSSRKSPTSLEGSAVQSPTLSEGSTVQSPPSLGMVIAEGNLPVLNERKMSDLSLESQADSDFVSCTSTPKVKYFTKNMNCLLLEVDNCYKLHCTSVADSNDSFYCQLLDDTAILRYFELMEDLAKLCSDSSEEPAFMPEKGQLVAAKYLDDWYRAKVLSTQEDKVEVFFIDYGNVSLVAKEQLREIISEIFVEFPILAVRCCLTGISEQKQKNEISKFQDQTMNVKVIGKVGNAYQIVFDEDLEEELEDEDVPLPPLPSKSAEDDEKERIQRQIEELQRKLATLN